MTSKSPKNTNSPDVEKITLKNTNSPDVKEITLKNKSVKKSSDGPSSPEPSHIMTGEYAALMETNGKECESWYYFIRREGNEEALQHLHQQLEKIDWYVLDDLSTFDLDLEHFVDAKTAKQMTKLELNSYAFHRKFDGKLQNIDFNFRKKDLKKNDRMMCKVFDLLGYGQIEDYISDEDLDPEDLTDHESSSESDTEDDSESDTEDDSDDDSDDDSESEDAKHSSGKKVGQKGLPPALKKIEIPRWAKAKKRKQRQKRS